MCHTLFDQNRLGDARVKVARIIEYFLVVFLLIDVNK